MKTNTKMFAAAQVFASDFYLGVARKETIQKFIKEVGLTQNGAATYYQKMKSAARPADFDKVNADIAARLPRMIPVTQMTNKQLVETYNQFRMMPGRHVNRFATRQVGIRRVTELLDSLNIRYV